MLLTVPAFLEAAREGAEHAGIADEVYVLGEAEGAKPFADLFGDPEAAPEVEIDPGHVAVLPYSSGTTGLPKGVMLTHANLVANLCQIEAGWAMYEDDTVIGVLPFFHIYGMVVIMNQGLRGGATIVTMPRFDLEQFLELIDEHGVTRAYVVPPIALALAKHPAVEGRDVSSVEVIMCGAAPLGAELAGAVADRIDCKRDPGLRPHRDEPGHPHDSPGRREQGRARSAGRSGEHRVPPGRSRERGGRRRGRAGGAVDPRPAGDEGLPEQRRGDRGDRRRRGLAAHGRRRGRGRRRLLRDRRPPQGADQVQGVPGRPGRARGADRQPTPRSPTSR